MELKIRQELVQNAGTITAFNYAYCKTIYDKACSLRETDIVDANEEKLRRFDSIFDNIGDSWIEDYQKRCEAANKAISNINENPESNRIINASHIVLKKGSLLPILVEHLEEQTKIKNHIDFPSSYYFGEEVEEFRQQISLFFKQVGLFLAMFEF